LTIPTKYLLVACSPEGLKELFSPYGEIGDVYIPRSFGSNEPRGFAFVRFVDKKDAEDALRALDNTEYEGRTLAIQEAKERRPDNPRGAMYVPLLVVVVTTVHFTLAGSVSGQVDRAVAMTAAATETNLATATAMTTGAETATTGAGTAAGTGRDVTTGTGTVTDAMTGTAATTETAGARGTEDTAAETLAETLVETGEGRYLENKMLSNVLSSFGAAAWCYRSRSPPRSRY
jgi:hypothetical protein